ncbi:MAG: hypothetical protein O3C15_08495, partial [Proteobacteria bacterium]|nr:hypothetical protein [Pseudomonadota bacterium]
GNLAGREIAFTPPGADAPANFRFLEGDEEKPSKRTMVLVRRSGLNQTDMEKGLAYGQLYYQELQDADTGEPQVNIKVRRPGEHVSFSLTAAEWAGFTDIAIAAHAEDQ